jgi:hypothetical protein
MLPAGYAAIANERPSGVTATWNQLIRTVCQDDSERHLPHGCLPLGGLNRDRRLVRRH